jgi:hypothetical protein
MPTKSTFEEPIVLFAEIEHETPAAYKLNDGFVTAWVPKSQVKKVGEGMFEVPPWIIEKKGFKV